MTRTAASRDPSLVAFAVCERRFGQDLFERLAMEQLGDTNPRSSDSRP